VGNAQAALRLAPFGARSARLSNKRAPTASRPATPHSTYATLAARTGTGIYRIAFNTDITNCVYLATAGQDAGGVSGDYNIFTSCTSTTTVNVVIFDGSNRAHRTPHTQTCANTSDQPVALTLTESHLLHRVTDT
jgi:hypothetical protein